MKKNTIRRRQISRDCWDLDYAYLKWLKEHLPVFLRQGGKVVDLDYQKFEWGGEIYTQAQLIRLLISLVNRALEIYNNDNDYFIIANNIHDIWKMLFTYMWW